MNPSHTPKPVEALNLSHRFESSSGMSTTDRAKLDFNRLVLGLEFQKNELGSIADELLELLREAQRASH
jgi:hypothetical protein